MQLGLGLTNIAPPALGINLGAMLSKKASITLEFGGSGRIDIPTGPGAWISSRYGAIDFRYFPYGGSFLIGLGLGVRQIKVGVDSIYIAPPQPSVAASASPDISAISWVADLNQQYANYRFGWLWRATPTSGVALEFGTTSSFQTSVTMDADTSDISISPDEKKQIRKLRSDEINGFLFNKTLPLMALNLVWLFP